MALAYEDSRSGFIFPHLTFFFVMLYDCREVRSCKEMKSYLEKLQQDYESSLSRNSAVAKGKSAESEEALNSVSVARVNYRTASVDTVYTITLLQQRKRFEILDDVSFTIKIESIKHKYLQLILTLPVFSLTDLDSICDASAENLLSSRFRLF